MQTLKKTFAIFCILLAGCGVAEIRIESPRTGVAVPVTNAPPATQVMPVSPTPLVLATDSPPAQTAVPRAEPTFTSFPSPTPQIKHIVQRGENLFRIALKYGVTVDTLRAVNGIAGDTIFVGQELSIPAASESPNPQPTTASPTTVLPATELPTTRPPDQPTAQPSGPFWDTSPTTRIIRLYGGWSMVGACNPTNYYILQAQVWGDGRIIWVESDGIARRVFEGKLTTDQMKSLLRYIVEAGFFGWKDYYDALGGNSYSPRYLSVNLIAQSKEISEHGAAPGAFYELRDFISNGAGVVGHEFVPVRGYLTATSFPWATEEEQERLPLWPDHAANFTLDQVGNGRYIEGEALAAVWQAVNQNPRACVLVKSKGQVYAVAVQIPEVFFNEPPAP